MSTAPAGLPRGLTRLLALISDLRLAIVLLLLLALASGMGTAIPQQEPEALYHRLYDDQPWLGLLRGDAVLALQLDHVYSSGWFLALLAWLGLALLLCSWRRQWPALQASLRWIDYSSPRQLSKLSLAETTACAEPDGALERLAATLRAGGWQVRLQPHRLAARRGILGRVGPLLVHAGLVMLLVGAAWGALAGQRLEQFLAPGRELELMDSRGNPQLTIALDDFAIERDPAGRPEQFRSRLRLIPPASGESSQSLAAAWPAEISVNHPLRHRGITLYQADWALAALNLQLGRSPVLQVPLRSFPELGEQVWGVVLPTRPDGSDPVFLALTSEQGPADVYGPEGQLLGRLAPGGAPLDVRGLPVRLVSVLPASGILLKRDPGVPLVYAGFAVALLGGGLSIVATRQLWAVAEPAQGRLHLAGLCNRNLPALAAELPPLLALAAQVAPTEERAESPLDGPALDPEGR
ncbi:MAG: cytochrome c biogenesis protein ResB [Synechococcaceae cyanobacterium]|nr:cytochrome c biogenesis protein ResB [Synechococcaceae cyanobacterium]